MRDIQYISTGEVDVVQGDVVLQSTPIGSCIVIMTWHRASQTGGMAHIMLPGLAKKTEPYPTKYAINALEKLREVMGEYESLTNLGVFAVGGANVLKKPDDTVSLDNILSITSVLSQMGIPIVRSVLGGFERRTASLDTQSGRIEFTQGNSPPQILWDPDIEIVSSPISVLQ